MIFSLDCETYIYNSEKQEYEPILNTNKFVLGAVSWKTSKGNTKTEYFEKVEEMKEWIKKKCEEQKAKRRTCYFYAHAGQYDYYGIYKNEYQNHKIMRLSPIMVKIHENGFILDSFSFFPFSLKELGEKIGLPKMEMPRNPTTISEIYPYITRDTEIVLEAMTKLKKDLKELGINPKAMFTSGQIAINNYMNWIQKNQESWQIMNEHREIIGTQYDEFCRKAYKIGRCEAFQTGSYEDVTYLDKNSLFPYAMTQIEFPDLRREYVMHKVDEKININEFLERYTGCCKATVKIPKIDIGFLGIKYQDYLIFPNKEGNYLTGYWTIPELKKAKEIGYKIIKIYEAVFYPKIKKNPFKNYMEMMYKKRMENPELAQTIKLLMNNVHGKLGQNIQRKDIIIDTRDKYNEYVLENGWTAEAEVDNKIYYTRKQSNYKPKYVNVMLSALIVSKAREIMWQEYSKIPIEDLIYTDVDSIIFKGKHKDKFIIGKELGKFKIEQENVPCHIRKEKMYWIGDKIKSSGVNKKRTVCSCGNEECKKYENETKDHKKVTKELTKEMITNGNDFTNIKMITLPQAMQIGKQDLIGTFTTEKVHITERMKLEIELPKHAIENE